MPTATEGGDKEEESCYVVAPLPATAQLRRFDCHAEDTDKEVTGGNMDQDHAFKRETECFCLFSLNTQIELYNSIPLK